MRLIYKGDTVLTWDEATEKLTVDIKFNSVPWKRDHMVLLSTFFGRAENTLMGINTKHPLPDVVINE